MIVADMASLTDDFDTSSYIEKNLHCWNEGGGTVVMSAEEENNLSSFCKLAAAVRPLGRVLYTHTQRKCADLAAKLFSCLVKENKS